MISIFKMPKVNILSHIIFHKDMKMYFRVGMTQEAQHEQSRKTKKTEIKTYSCYSD